jgi:NhaP-type Na+/H+ or K+/H+ antiporter
MTMKFNARVLAVTAFLLGMATVTSFQQGPLLQNSAQASGKATHRQRLERAKRMRRGENAGLKRQQPYKQRILSSNNTEAVNYGFNNSTINTKATLTAIEQGSRSTDAVLFPSFCVILGVLVYFVVSRVPFLTQWLPYTAAMFLVGTAMGVGTTVLRHDNILNKSIQVWTDIDAATLLLVFLPGLIYKEISVGLNVHLFRASLWQNIVFAFPLVLAGATLTALVAFYIFPYNWSFDLCMAMGSILAATDTVAIAVLMNELGASPRLKVHVSGESLLNDGSVIVLNSLFVARYLFELGIPGFGDGASKVANVFRVDKCGTLNR